MAEMLVVATAGAGGDLQPLVAAALALRDRGHTTRFLGDRSVARSLSTLGVRVETLPAELDLGPSLAAAIRDAMSATEGDQAAAGPIVVDRLSAWAARVAAPVANAVRRHRPDVVVTSLFGVEVLSEAAPPCRWAVVNSTFYIGPDPPRPLEADVSPRALPLLARMGSLVGQADLVLHATDQEFDFSFDRLPSGHHYVGPLGIWEPPSERPAYVEEPGDPWVLVSISSQRQDDVPLAQAALSALSDLPVRAIVTLGPDHTPDEIGAVPGNARVVRTVSHAAVLERARLLVGHAGHGSVMKALWHGRPMVLVPWGRDQPGVAARAARLGVAAVVPRDRAVFETISAAIDRALADPGMQAAAARHGARLSATDPASTAASLLERLL